MPSSRNSHNSSTINRYSPRDRLYPTPSNIQNSSRSSWSNRSKHTKCAGVCAIAIASAKSPYCPTGNRAKKSPYCPTGNRAIKNAFCQFDAYSRRLDRWQGGVLRYVPAASVATPTQKTRKMAKSKSPYCPAGNRAKKSPYCPTGNRAKITKKSATPMLRRQS